MKELFESFFLILSKIGLVGFLTLIFLFLIVSWIYDVIKYYNPNIIKRIFRSKNNVDFNIIIKRLNYIKSHDVKNADIYCEKRKKILIDFITIRINNIIKILEEDNLKIIGSMENEELYLFLEDKIFAALEKADSDMLISDIPYAILERYKIIEDDEMKILDKFIKQICFSKKIYGNNFEKVFIVFDFLCVIAKMAVINAEETIDKLNGQLDGVLYKGISCENCRRPECKKYKGHGDV